MAAAGAADAKGDGHPKVAHDGTVIQDDDERKYDRQMRLWGAHGQKRLQEAHIAVLHSGPTATESLKNLVLPNVGAFTVIDNAKVTAADLGNNWFVDKSHIGQSRAKAVTELLLEMNPEVKGHALEADPVVQIDTKLDSFAAYQLVIACQLPEASVKKLAAFLYARNIPLVVVRSIGLFGYMRSIFPEQTVVESHPINDRSDIYVHPKQIALWPELAKYCESFDFNKVDTRTHRHIPYIAILHQQMKKWQAANGGKVPTTGDETKAFRAAIDAARRHDPSAPPAENFNEAVQNAHRAFRLPELDDKVVAVLEDAKGQPANITKASTNYWVLVAALNAWRADPKGGAGVLMPVSTNIPDMHSLSDLYIQLKDIFAERAKADLAGITAHANALTAKAGRSAVPAKEIDLFVKHCRCLYVVRTRSLEQELDAKTFPTEDVNDKLTDYVDLKDQEREEGVLKGPHNLHWYFTLRAAERFHQKHNRYPGHTQAVMDDTTADLKELTALATALYAELKVDAAPNEQVLKEFVRYAMSEVHAVAAFMGGMGAQEALKLLIGQYVPNNNTVIYNAVHASLSHFKF